MKRSRVRPSFNNGAHHRNGSARMRICDNFLLRLRNSAKVDLVAFETKSAKDVT